MRWHIPLFLSGALILGAGPSATAQRGQSPPEATVAARRELVETRAEATRARDRAALLDRQARSATLASERAILSAAALAARIQLVEASLSSADAELVLLRARRQALDRRLARERVPMARLIAGLQSQVRRPALLALLQPGSLADAVHLRAVATALGPQIAARTASLRSSLERSRDLERRASLMAVERRRLQAGLVARRGQLAAVAATQRLTAQRAAGAADREAERAFAIAEQSRSLATLIRRVEAARAERRTPVPRLTGVRESAVPDGFRLPVMGSFKPARDASGRGLALLPRPGALVVAPAYGRVAFAGPYRGFGQVVIIEHPAGLTSLVTGLARVQVAVGQTLVAGSPLGSAPMDRPEVGFELRRNGRNIDPLDHRR